MATVGKLGRPLPSEPHVQLVHQFGGLQRIMLRALAQIRGGNPSQFFVSNFDQIVECPGDASAPALQKASDIAWNLARGRHLREFSGGAAGGICSRSAEMQSTYGYHVTMALTNTRAASTPARYRTFETPRLLSVDVKSDRTAHVTKIIQAFRRSCPKCFPISRRLARTPGAGRSRT